MKSKICLYLKFNFNYFFIVTCLRFNPLHEIYSIRFGYYVGYGAWFLITVILKTDWRTIGKDGKESRSVLVWYLDLPVPFGSVLVQFSMLWELELFTLELEESGSGPDRSGSVWQKWGNGIKEGPEEWSGGNHPR